MARSTQTILNSILTSIRSTSVLNALNSTSQVALYNLFAYVIAVAQNQQEIINDEFVAVVEALVLTLAPATPQWIQQQAFNFQYNATNPQIIQFSTASIAPYYSTVNRSYEIVTNCSVTTPQPGQVNVLLASGGTAGTGIPAALSNPQLQAIQYYFNTIKPAGIIYNCISEAGDLLFSQFTIYYYGVYASTIQNTLLSAYNKYLENISFGGTVYLAQIVSTLLQIKDTNGNPMVSNVICNKMVARTALTPFGLGTTMVTGNDWIITTYQTIAGYIVDEPSPNNFLSNLTLIAV